MGSITIDHRIKNYEKKSFYLKLLLKLLKQSKCVTAAQIRTGTITPTTRINNRRECIPISQDSLRQVIKEMQMTPMTLMNHLLETYCLEFFRRQADLWSR